MNLTKEKPVPVSDEPRLDHHLVKKIVGQVMESLGVPPGWTHTKAVNIFDNRWRVNVYAKQPNTTNVLVVRSGIVDSFFLIVDGEKVTTEIARKY